MVDEYNRLGRRVARLALDGPAARQHVLAEFGQQIGSTFAPPVPPPPPAAAPAPAPAPSLAPAPAPAAAPVANGHSIPDYHGGLFEGDAECHFETIFQAGVWFVRDIGARGELAGVLLDSAELPAISGEGQGYWSITEMGGEFYAWEGGSTGLPVSDLFAPDLVDAVLGEDDLDFFPPGVAASSAMMPGMNAPGVASGSGNYASLMDVFFKLSILAIVLGIEFRTVDSRAQPH